MEDEEIVDEALIRHIENNIEAAEEEANAMVFALAHMGGYLIGLLEDDEEHFEIHDYWESVDVDFEGYRRMGDPSFKRHFRLSKECFEALLLVVANHLVGMERVQRVRTPLDIVLLMVLWVLANPDTFRSVALRFGCQPGTVYFHYSYIIECLREMAPTYIRWPNANERAEIKEAFQAYSGFPGIIGVIDGTHNVITAPVRQKRRYRNRFQSYSLNTQVVCDHTLLIREIHIGEVGSVFDQRALSRSPLYRKLLEALQEFLGFDEHLIGDGAYTLIRSLLVPFRNIGNLTPQQRLYNQLLSRCRARIEHAFGKAFGQWRRMKFLHCVNLDIAVDHIMACFVLHNFMILHGEVMLDLNDFADEAVVEEYLNNFVRDIDFDEEVVNEEDEDMAARLREARDIGVEKRWEIVHAL